jgi:hypothetical protein
MASRRAACNRVLDEEVQMNRTMKTLFRVGLVAALPGLSLAQNEPSPPSGGSPDVVSPSNKSNRIDRDDMVNDQKNAAKPNATDQTPPPSGPSDTGSTSKKNAPTETPEKMAPEKTAPEKTQPAPSGDSKSPGAGDHTTGP